MRASGIIGVALVVAACGGAAAPAPAPTVTLAASPAAAVTATPSPRPVPSIDPTFASEDCGAPEASQFDFWVGTWDVQVRSANGVEVTGTNTITKTGCRIFEHFDAPLGGRAGYIGESLSLWVPSIGMWQQRYADNSGFAATYSGTFASGAMTLFQSSPDGRPQNTSRLVWRDIQADRLLWHNEVTRDGGQTWTPNIVIRYERRR